MKAVAKNFLKAICYVLLFYGMQILVSFAVLYIYGFIAGFEAGMSGETLDTQALNVEMQMFLLKNQNIFLLISNGITLLFLWIFFKCRKKKITQEIQICKFDKRMIVPIIVMGCSLSLFISSVLCQLPLPQNLTSSYAEASQGLINGSLIIRILTLVVMTPIVEEIVFRGLVFSRLKRGMKTPLAVLLSSLIFALMHGQLIWISYTFVVGILFAVIVEKTKSLNASILCHMALNSVSALVGGINITGTKAYIMILVTFVLVMASLMFVLRSNNFTGKNNIKCEMV